MTEMSATNAKLVQYLNEAYGLEARLETALQAHIAMTTDAAYKKRLKAHLSETKRHSKELKRRVKQLGGVAATIDAPGPAPVGDAAQAVIGGAQKAVALAQGPLHALRGTGSEEKQLKNAKTEYASESQEIAGYAAIEALSAALGDKDTQRLALSIRRDEERMRSYLEKLIPRLSKAVAKAEVPVSQRATRTRARRAKGSRAGAGAARTKAASRAKTTTRKRSASTRSAASGRARSKGARAL